MRLGTILFGVSICSVLFGVVMMAAPSEHWRIWVQGPGAVMTRRTQPSGCQNGDHDGNGRRNQVDVAILADWLSGTLQTPCACPPDKYGDMNSDGSLNAADLVELQRQASEAK